MPKSFAKVHKKISKKKGSLTALNENSRDSQRLRRAVGRDDKLARVAVARAKINKPHLKRVAFFQGAAKAADAPLETEVVQRLIESYIHRDNEELEKLMNDRRPGRPASNREDLLKQRIAIEEKEYDSGFWIPNMLDQPNLELLRRWPGEWTSLNTIKYIRMNRSGATFESSFPPKGQS